MEIKQYWRDDVLVSSHTRGQKRKKSVRKRPFRAKLTRIVSLLKWIFWITVATYFLSTIEVSYKPFESKNAAEAKTELPLNGATSFESADIPRDVEAREVTRGDLFDKYFGKDSRIIRAICKSESGLKADSMNKTLNKDKTWDIGYCQINVDWNAKYIPGETRAEKIENLKNPETNVMVAKRVYDSQGWTAWSDFKNGKYLRYLDK